jgi:large subunit ribosomal protein L17
MRHNVKGKKLNRDTSHRKALSRNLSDSLISHRSVETTLAKAKYIRPYVERLVTRAKKDQSFLTVKYLESRLATEGAVKALMNEIAPMYQNRNGGYTRIVKLPLRSGDKAPMARIEFIIEKPKKSKAVKTEEVKETAVEETK